MGLTIRALKESDDYVDSSYSGFNAIREKFFAYAKKVFDKEHKKEGKELYDLSEYTGFGGDKILPSYILFYELINHSDCDGELDFDECIELNEDFREHSEKFIKFIKESNESDESIEFDVEWIESFESMVNDVATEKYHSLIFV